MESDEFFMREALVEAKCAFDRGEVPVGAVLVLNKEIIARGGNRVEESKDSSEHAEMGCLRTGSKILGNWRLLGARLYCTLEPCPMCAGAMIHARLESLVWGAPDLRCGAHGSWVNLFDIPHPIHQVKVVKGVLAEESALLMKEFFRNRRSEKC